MQHCVYKLTKYLGCNTNIRHIHSSGLLFKGTKWRIRNGLPRAGNEYGPLRDSPDFSFPDGRPVPLSMAARLRKINQFEQGKKIIQLIEEVDFAVEREAQMRKEQEEQKQQLLKEKLKPKGDSLLN